MGRSALLQTSKLGVIRAPDKHLQRLQQQNSDNYPEYRLNYPNCRANYPLNCPKLSGIVEHRGPM